LRCRTESSRIAGLDVSSAAGSEAERRHRQQWQDSRMAHEEQAPQRTARNEAIFREVNEALKAGRWPGEEGAPIAFRCECGRLGCSRLVELTSKEYERIRAHPRRFVVAPGHDGGAQRPPWTATTTTWWSKNTTKLVARRRRLTRDANR
jgi:hypothetical protein